MQEPKEDQRSGPLSDLKVLDLAGPIGVYCAKLMADLGADVVRIEPPKGDSMREIGPFFDDDPNPEKSLYWWHFNTSKRGVTLDLEHPEGQEIFRRLVKWADIGVESFPPGCFRSIAPIIMLHSGWIQKDSCWRRSACGRGGERRTWQDLEDSSTPSPS